MVESVLHFGVGDILGEEKREEGIVTKVLFEGLLELFMHLVVASHQ